MSSFEHDSALLGRIHQRNNDRKFFCHFTGFLEGIAASGHLERGEQEPLIAECLEFVRRVSDNDAADIIEDFRADLLEFDVVADAVSVRVTEIDAECEKSSLNRFLGFCRGVVCDGEIVLREAQLLKETIESTPSLMGVVGVRQILITCLDALEDGIISPEESEEMCNAIGAIVGDSYGDTGLAQPFGVSNFQETQLDDISTAFEGKTVVLTGVFEAKPRRIFEDALAAYGAVFAKQVSKKTEFLIVGGEASRDWIELNRGTKLRKAQELRLQQEAPAFVSEGQIKRLIAKASAST